jgi:hypothetical protein
VQTNAKPGKMKFGEELQKPTWIKSRRSLGRCPLLERDLWLLDPGFAPIGVKGMDIVSLVIGAISNTLGPKVVVRWLVVLAEVKAKEAPKEKVKAKAIRAEKEKGVKKEAGIRETQPWW